MPGSCIRNWRPSVDFPVPHVPLSRTVLPTGIPQPRTSSSPGMPDDVFSMSIPFFGKERSRFHPKETGDLVDLEFKYYFRIINFLSSERQFAYVIFSFSLEAFSFL